MFGKYESHSPYYLITMVFHDQSLNIQKDLDLFEKSIANEGFPNHAIHTMPLIRNDQDEYKVISKEKRIKLFTSLFTLTYKLPIKYTSIIVEKKPCDDDVTLSFNLSKKLSKVLKENFDYINKFDKIIIYYDNGQTQLTKIILSIFGVIFNNVEFRKVLPVDYKLFQIADLLCSLDLLFEKAIHSGFTKSELSFFGSIRLFKRNYYNQLKIKKL